MAGGLDSHCFDRKKFSFRDVACAPLSPYRTANVPKVAPKIAKGVWQSWRVLRAFSPHVVVGFGSFFTFPTLVAAALMRTPIVLHEQNIVPGKVNRFFSSIACTTAVTFASCSSRLRGNSVEVSLPLRESSAVDELSVWKYFGLCKQLPTLLVFGGSQGAAGLNALFLEALVSLPPVQVLHFIGKRMDLGQVAKRYRDLGLSACVKRFEPRMDLAMRIADIAVVRAGAGTITECIEHTLPALLVPFPHASENHQVKNAEHFAREIGGGEICLEGEASAEGVSTLIRGMLDDLPARRRKIQEYRSTRCRTPLAQVIEDVIS